MEGKQKAPGWFVRKGVSKMKYGCIQIDFEGKKARQILERLEKAIGEIYECYSELERLGVVTVKEDGTS